jgi:hypothetical protein
LRKAAEHDEQASMQMTERALAQNDPGETTRIPRLGNPGLRTYVDHRLWD